MRDDQQDEALCKPTREPLHERLREPVQRILIDLVGELGKERGNVVVAAALLTQRRRPRVQREGVEASVRLAVSTLAGGRGNAGTSSVRYCTLAGAMPKVVFQWKGKFEPRSDGR